MGLKNEKFTVKGSKVPMIIGLLVMSLISGQSRFKIGVDAGYTYSVLNADVSNLIDSKYKARYGVGVNLFGEYQIWNTLFVATGVSYQQKNFGFERTGSKEGWYTDYNSEFLQLPLLVGGYILKNPYEESGFWIKVAGGMYSEYWLRLKREGQYPVFNELQEDGSFPYTKVSDTYDFKKNENQFNRWGYGVLGQGQLGYSFDKINIYASYLYQYGLADIDNSNRDRSRKSTIDSYLVSLGIAYTLK